MNYSFGYVVLLNSRPDLAFDLNELPQALIENGSLDQIAAELELIGSGDATTLRTNALRAYALRVDSGSAYTTGHNIAADDPALGVWVAAVCARHVLERTSVTGRKIDEGLDLIQASLRGEADWQVVSNAGKEMDRIGDRYSSYTQGERRRAAMALRWAIGAAWKLFRGMDDLAIEDAGTSIYHATDVYDEGSSEAIKLNQELSEKIVEALPGFPVRTVYDTVASR